MMRKLSFLIPSLVATLLVVHVTAQNADITSWINGPGGAKPALAVTEFRGGAGAQEQMAPFNATLFSDLQNSALFDMKSKSLFPLANPQRPEDLRPEDNKQGYALQDWSGAPVGASHLVFGYSSVVNNVLVLYGYVYDARQANIQAAQLLTGRYTGSVDQAGAIKVAHEFANDIIQKFGGVGSLLGSRIYFVSDRGAPKNVQEIWAMDWDGNNQKQLTNLRSLAITPGISADGTRLAFTSYARGTPSISVLNTETGRALSFYNQQASINTTPNFSPDGKLIYYASSASGSTQIVAAGVDGQGFRRVSRRNAVEVEPKVNPKNPGTLLFVSGPGSQQIYRMNTDGAAVERVTNGEGEASNPSWHPDGQHIAFSSTAGFARGGWNIFVMDIANRQVVQLTHGEGKNENPTWAPDGLHIAFASNRSGRSQIYTMLANGTQVKQLTQQGTNKYPVWGSK
jgi:TolB protein